MLEGPTFSERGNKLHIPSEMVDAILKMVKKIILTPGMDFRNSFSFMISDISLASI